MGRWSGWMMALAALALLMLMKRETRPQVALATPADSARRHELIIRIRRALFQDERLSSDSSMSCGSCHAPAVAFAEKRSVSQGIGRLARRRNAPSLVDVAVFRTAFDWDGRAQSLDDQLLGVFSIDGDMGIDSIGVVTRLRGDARVVKLFAEAFGRGPTFTDARHAIVAFVRTLSAGPSRFERYYLHGDSTVLTDREFRGWTLFRENRLGCSGCHVPLPDPEGSGLLVFTDNSTHNLGVGYREGRFADSGRYEVTGQGGDVGAFRTPSLRNVALTAPYMHDGSIETLEEVLQFYMHGGIPNPHLDPVIVRRGLTGRERQDLVAFLKSLTAEWLADSSAVSRAFFATPAESPETRLSVRTPSAQTAR